MYVFFGGFRRVGAELLAFGQPLLAAAVHNSDILVAVQLQLPERPGGKPVVVVAVQDNRGVVVDSRRAKQFFELVLRNHVAHDRVAQLRRPVPADGARHMTLIVGRRVDVDLGDANLGILEMVSDPVRY